MVKQVKCVITAYGYVQRVGYRYRVEKIARKLGLRGYVQNKPDGSVQIVAEGPKEALERFADAIELKELPINVEKVEVRYEKATGGFKFFQIKADELAEEMIEGFAAGLEYLGLIRAEMRQGFAKMDKRNEEVSRTLKSLAEDFRRLVDFVEQLVERR